MPRPGPPHPDDAAVAPAGPSAPIKEAWRPGYTTAAFWGGAIALAMVVVLALGSMERLASSRALVVNTHEAIASAEQVLGLARDAETGVRGYLLAGRAVFLEPYRSAVAGAGAALDDLHARAAGDPERAAPARTVDERTREVFVALEAQRQTAETNAAFTGEALDARITASLDGTKQRMDALRAAVAAFVDAERTRLAVRRDDADARYATTRLVVVVAGAIGVAGLLFAATLNGRQLRALQASRAELQQVNGSLEERIRERTSDLQQATLVSATRAAELATAYKDLESFSYSVSHDLKSPLRSIEGFSTILTRKLKGTIDADAYRQLEVVRTSAQHMGRLIADVLAFSRLGREAMKPVQLQLADLAKQVLDERRQDLVGRTVEIAVAPDLPPCTGDRTLLYQVLSNLLGNAIKYSRETAAARIELGWQRGASPDPATGQPAAAAQTIVYRIADNGIGFDMRYYDKLFGVFQRIHTSDAFEGTGIGLATVKKIVERHRGRIWAEGRPGAGSTFYFTLGELP